MIYCLRNYKIYNKIINYTIHHRKQIEIIKITSNSRENLIRNFSLNIHFNNNNNNSNNHIVKLAFNEYGNELDADKNTGDTGETSPIVIMHGLFGSKQNWKSICKAITAKSEPKRKIYAIDARNHGDSPHSMDHSYENLADDIWGFLNEQNIRKSIVIGHSMGGRAMMCLALKYPEMVEKAIIIDIAPETHSPSFQKMGLLFDAMNQIKIPHTLNMSAGRNLANEQLMKNVPDKATRDFVLMNLVKNADDGSFNWRVNVEALHHNFRANIGQFPVKYLTKKYLGSILFIGGSKSDYINESDLPQIKKLFPNATLEFIDSGHLVHVEKPYEFLEKVFKFINY